MHIGIDAHLLAFTGNYRQAGLSRYIYELLVQLPPLVERASFTAYVGSGTVPADFMAVKPGNLHLSRSRLPTVKAPVRIAWEQTVLPVAARRQGLDLLHCPVNVIPALSPCPTVLTIHDLIFLRYPEGYHPTKRFYLKAMTGWSARHATHVIAVSEATRQDVIELLGVSPGHVTTVQNGVGSQFGPISMERKREFKLSQRLPERVVFYVGTLEPRKNLSMLLRAFKAIADEPAFDDTTLVIGGSKGWYYDEIFATAERLGLASMGRVRFLGRVPDDELPLWYNIATVFAYPSIYEGFGLPVLEAMRCGAAVLTSNTSSMPEVVGSAGILLDPSDVGAWTRAMAALLNDEQARRELREAAVKQAGSFSWERSARGTAEVYRRVLAGRGALKAPARRK